MFDAYGAPALSPACAALLAKRKAALREMARSPLFSPRRRAAEKEANRVGKLFNACKRAAHKAKVEAKKARAIKASRPPPAPEAEPPDVPEIVDTPAGIVATPAGSVAAPSGPLGMPPNTLLIAGGVAALAIVALLLSSGGGNK
jgi:hypothetical protein